MSNRFIEFTYAGLRLSLARYHVLAVEETDSSTAIYTTDGRESFLVSESYDEVVRLLQAGTEPEEE